MPKDSKQRGELCEALYVQTRRGPCLSCAVELRTLRSADKAQRTRERTQIKADGEENPGFSSSRLKHSPTGYTAVFQSLLSNLWMYYSHTQAHASQGGFHKSGRKILSLKLRRRCLCSDLTEDACTLYISPPSQKVKLCKPASASGLN